MRGRGISDSVIRKFQVGYCPASIGHDLAGRIIMPLMDAYGEEVVSFTTRNPWTDKSFQHWHEPYDKSRYLYGLDVAKSSIIKQDKVIVVEGQFDTMVLHSYGFGMTVALCGTSISVTQIALLARYCSEIYLIFDPDEAGDGCIRRAFEIYKRYMLDTWGLLFVPVKLPKDTDPDDYVIKYGSDKLVALLRESKEKVINGRLHAS